MPIKIDPMSISEREMPDPVIASDFFTSEAILPEEDRRDDGDKPLDVKESFADWRMVVDKMFMSGKLGADIFKTYGVRISRCAEKEEILKYVEKYDGLIGTVFLDSAVFEAGFPIHLIPKKFKPYHRFAINCKHVRKSTSRYVEGGVGGDMDAFLNSFDEQKVQSVDVCAVTGLPVLKAGMFTSEVIAELMETLGEKGNSLKDLQTALKKHVYGLETYQKKHQEQEEKPDLDFGMRESEVEVEVEEAAPAVDVSKYNLKPRNASIKISKPKQVEIKEKARSSRQDMAVLKQGKTEHTEAYNLKAPANASIKISKPKQVRISGRAQSAETDLDVHNLKPIDGFRMDWKKAKGKDVFFADAPERAKVEIGKTDAGCNDVQIQKSARKMKGFKMDWDKNQQDDVEFDKLAETIDGIKLSGELLF